MRWVQQLRELGVDVEVTGDRAVISSVDGRATLPIIRASRSPRPSEIRPATNPCLLVAPHLTAGARQRLDALSRSWATADGDFDIHLGNTRLRSADLKPDDDVATDGGAGTATRPGPMAYGTAAVMRTLLIANEPLTQSRIAALVGITQPRVSQIMTDLCALGLVAHQTSGWRATDHRRLLSHWMRTTPRTDDDMSTLWASADADPWEATLHVLPLLTDVRVSGDTAADLYAPWRRPALSVIYTSVTIDLHSTGLVTAERPEEAVLRVATPADRTLIVEPPTWRTFRDTSVPLADPLIVWRDVAAGPGPDAREAADVLLAALPHELDWPA